VFAGSICIAARIKNDNRLIIGAITKLLENVTSVISTIRYVRVRTRLTTTNRV
jgi:hypothetical protein